MPCFLILSSNCNIQQSSCIYLYIYTIFIIVKINKIHFLILKEQIKMNHLRFKHFIWKVTLGYMFICISPTYLMHSDCTLVALDPRSLPPFSFLIVEDFFRWPGFSVKVKGRNCVRREMALGFRISRAETRIRLTRVHLMFVRCNSK